MKRRALLVCPVHPTRQQLIDVVRQTGADHVVTSSVREATEALKDGKYAGESSRVAYVRPDQRPAQRMAERTIALLHGPVPGAGGAPAQGPA